MSQMTMLILYIKKIHKKTVGGEDFGEGSATLKRAKDIKGKGNLNALEEALHHPVKVTNIL